MRKPDEKTPACNACSHHIGFQLGICKPESRRKIGQFGRIPGSDASRLQGGAAIVV
jgi:hypothetical protein